MDCFLYDIGLRHERVKDHVIEMKSNESFDEFHNLSLLSHFSKNPSNLRWKYIEQNQERDFNTVIFFRIYKETYRASFKWKYREGRKLVLHDQLSLKRLNSHISL